jgi:glycosyltransferase involved in cell wall biosynthesis
MPKLFSYGFPGLYGGAATELHHQIYAWLEIPEVQVCIIPNMVGYKNEPLYQEMLDLGVEIYEPHQFEVISKEDSIINFCSSTFLQKAEEIFSHTKRTMFVNCMTFLFDAEKECHKNGFIAHSLYQRPQVLEDHRYQLESLGSRANFHHFVPYFYEKDYQFLLKDGEYINIGRISRDAADKYTRLNTLIYEGIHAPKWKRGHFLGFGPYAQSVTGPLPKWITGYLNHNKFPVKEFYNTVDFIVQPTKTKENWPRIGLEAMYSGVPLVVDNRGGWQYMIEHGVTGYLCNHERDFMYYGSKLAYEPDTRERIADAAYQRARELSGLELSVSSWRRIFEQVYN